MKSRRLVIFLILGLVQGLWAGPTLAVMGSSLAGAPEVRLPVTPPPPSSLPPADRNTRQVRLETRERVNPPAPDFSRGVEIPTGQPLAQPMFDEKQLLGQVGAPPPPPSFPGYESPGPELRAPVSPPGQAGAAAPSGLPAQAGQQGGADLPGQWNLAADRIIGQHGSEYVEAVGQAALSRGYNSLKADFMRYYKPTRWVVLRGNVRVMWEGDVIEAEEAEFDLESMQGWIKRGRIYVSKSNAHLDTAYARKYDTSSYRFQNAKFTVCDGEKPAWSFTANEGDLNLEGRTQLWGGKFNVLDKPVAWAPYLSLPGSGKRQSGLLIPELGHSSRRGFFINQPYYQVLSDERDLTFYENYMSSRGLMQGLEYRHTEDSRTKGDWRLDFLHDAKVARTADQGDTNLQNDGYLRPNRNRWWLRSKLDSFVADPAWTFKLDMDMVSDQDYLREFDGGMSGYEKSREALLKDFGRDIDVADSLTRKSTAFLSRSWDRFGVNAKAVWTQNLAYMNGNGRASQNPTTQTLPEVNAFAFKDNITGTPLDLEASSRVNYFWREYGTRGVRTDLHPVLSLPLNLGPVTLIPSAGVRNTAYSVAAYEGEPVTTTSKKTPARTFFELGFTGFTELSRVFSLNAETLSARSEDVGKSQWGAIRHSIMPRLEFSYVPAPQSQNRLPSFDNLDRIQRQNTVTYSLTNVLDRKRTSVVGAPGQPGSNSTIPVVGTDYLDFLRLRVEQSFDRDEAARSEQLGAYKRRPFSDVLFETSVRPEKYITLTSRTYVSPYLMTPTEHEHSLVLNKEKLGELRFGHDYRRAIDEYKRRRTGDTQVLSVGADYYLTDKLKLVTDYRMDIAGHTDLQKSVGLTWRDQCYEIQTRYIRKPGDQAVELRFNLLDFGKP